MTKNNFDIFQYFTASSLVYVFEFIDLLLMMMMSIVTSVHSVQFIFVCLSVCLTACPSFQFVFYFYQI